MNRWYYGNFTIDDYHKIPSTNDLLFELAANNQISHNHIIRAEIQENGHGRYGRNWDSPQGNLYFSLLIRPNKILENPSLLSFIAAVAISQTIAALKPDLNIAHKWPNDILLNDKKLAGILLKTAGNKEKIDFIIIGIGLNIISHPAQANFAATDLKSEKIEAINLQELLKKFLNNFENLYEKFLNFGFTPIRNLWLQRAFKLNQTIIVNLSNQKITGCFKDLNNSGNLILEDENGQLKIISSAEIFI